MFGRNVLKPEIGRKPIYDNLYNKEGRTQSFSCANCKSTVGVDIVDCIGTNAQDPETVLGPNHGGLVREHFGILGKSLVNGWPFMSVVSCQACGQDHLVYVAVFEPRNGWEQAVLQGISQLLPSNPSINRTR
ncbi:MAG: hypothetical protein KA365_04435 [Arenimonas sp.]|nr:hypothetical protein [Arenimonas sp.]MBP6309145.1 hypothetical protein [Arenimonas sp.]